MNYDTSDSNIVKGPIAWMAGHSVAANLLMLVFLVDQAQEICCPLFQANLKKAGSRRLLWE
ncbi:MAG: hypothetical protein MUD09_03455, partial [Desulfobacterales bacterium]|nr:hypothetical protein [Desulfobacterales bacterium]